MMLSPQTAPRLPLAHARVDLLIVAALMLVVTTLAPFGGAQTTRLTTKPSKESRYSRSPEQEITFQQGLLHYSRAQLPQAEQEFASVIKTDPADA